MMEIENIFFLKIETRIHRKLSGGDTFLKDGRGDGEKNELK